MTVKVLLFARARDVAGADAVDLELSPGGAVSDLRRALAAAYPKLAGLAARSAVAVNSDYASDDAIIPPGAEIALVPPVSGGCVELRAHFTDGPFSARMAPRVR